MGQPAELLQRRVRNPQGLQPIAQRAAGHRKEDPVSDHAQETGTGGDHRLQGSQGPEQHRGQGPEDTQERSGQTPGSASVQQEHGQEMSMSVGEKLLISRCQYI